MCAGEDNFHLAIKLQFHTYSPVSYVHVVYSRVTWTSLDNEEHVLTIWWLDLNSVSILTGLPLSSIYSSTWKNVHYMHRMNTQWLSSAVFRTKHTAKKEQIPATNMSQS
jgi:hypothetical protein